MIPPPIARRKSATIRTTRFRFRPLFLVAINPNITPIKEIPTAIQLIHPRNGNIPTITITIPTKPKINEIRFIIIKCSNYSVPRVSKVKSA